VQRIVKAYERYQESSGGAQLSLKLGEAAREDEPGEAAGL
jgi:hypothetical protein